MNNYAYEARDSATNKIVKSTVQAESESTAAKLLTAQGMVPLHIKLENPEPNIFSKYIGRITAKDKIVFTRQLATLIGAGLPLAQSMRTVLEQTANKKMQKVIRDIISRIEGGKALSEAFAKHPEVFDNVFISLVQAGEASGTLDNALKRIAIQQEKDAAMLSKIKGALAYPIIVLVVILLVIAFMLFNVVPQVKNLYKDLNQELPMLTQIMVNGADFFINYWWVVLAAIAVGIYFMRQYLITDSGRRNADIFKLNVPLFKGMMRKLYMARFTRTGQILLSTGVPMLDMLEITSDAVGNVIISEIVQRSAEKVKSGKALSFAIKKEDYILEMVPNMIKIGEQSGKIDEMMGKCAQIYEDELDEELKMISTAIEPILMVFLAIVAGGMVGAILFPIYSLVENIQV